MFDYILDLIMYWIPGLLVVMRRISGLGRMRRYRGMDIALRVLYKDRSTVRICQVLQRDAEIQIGSTQRSSLDPPSVALSRALTQADPAPPSPHLPPLHPPPLRNPLQPAPRKLPHHPPPPPLPRQPRRRPTPHPSLAVEHHLRIPHRLLKPKPLLERLRVQEERVRRRHHRHVQRARDPPGRRQLAGLAHVDQQRRGRGGGG